MGLAIFQRGCREKGHLPGRECRRAICGAQLTKRLTTLVYHLEHTHGMEKGAAAKKQSCLPFKKTLSGGGFVIDITEQLCLTWASIGLSYALIDDAQFRTSFGTQIPSGKFLPLEWALQVDQAFRQRCRQFARG